MNKRYFKESIINSRDIVFAQMGKLGSNKILMNVTDAFVMLIPILIAGSVAIIARVFLFAADDAIASSILGWIGLAHTSIMNNGTIPVVQSAATALPSMGPIVSLESGLYVFNPSYNVVNGMAIYALISRIGSNVFLPLQLAPLDHLSLFVLMALSLSIAKSNNSKSPILAIIIGVGAFFLISGGSDGFLFWEGKNLPMDGTRLMPAMFTGFVFVSIFEWLSRNPKMHIKMVAGVPPAVSTSFAKLLPAVITLLIALGINGIFSGFAYFAGLGGTYSLAQGIAAAIQAPFMTLVSNKEAQLAIGILYVSSIATLWFFGLHGSSVLGGIFAPFLLAGLLQNEAARLGEGEISVLTSSTFYSFVFLGGSGGTISLVAATMLFSKRKATREIAYFGGPPSIFNINEPIIFGYPIILNLTLLIPFVFNQIILFIITYVAIIVLRWVPPSTVIVPWTSPVGIGGFLATQSWQGALLAIFNFLVAASIYMPFVLLANKRAKANGEELVNPYAKFKRMKANINK